MHDDQLAPNCLTEARLHIRWMVRLDFPAVLEIDADQPDAWDGDRLLEELRPRNRIGMAIEWGEHVVGFMVYELHDSRLEVLKLAVHQDHRRCGIGGRLVRKLLDKLSAHRRPRLLIDVDEGNLAAQLFLRTCGGRAHIVCKDTYRFVWNMEECCGR